MNKELMPCPFCGSVPLVNIIEPHKHGFSGMPDHPGSCVIECGCGAGLIDDTQELVSNRWNTRAESSSEPAQLEKAPEPVYQINFSGIWLDVNKIDHTSYIARNYDGRILYTSPPFTSLPNPDLAVIGDALGLALYHAKIAFQRRHANADKELDTVNNAIAAFKRLTGDV